jgi:hypothetical protein
MNQLYIVYLGGSWFESRLAHFTALEKDFL